MLEALLRQIAELRDVSAADLMPALQEICGSMQTLLLADRCSLMICDDQTANYVSVSVAGVDVDQLLGMQVSYGTGLFGWIGEREELISLADSTKSERYVDLNLPDITSLPAFLGVPVNHQGSLVGMIIVERATAGHFSESDEASLVTLSTKLADSFLRIQQTRAFCVEGKPRQRREPKVFAGIAGAPGIAIGRAFIIYPLADFSQVPERQSEDPEQEWQHFRDALSATRKQIRAIADQAKSSLSVVERALFDAYIRILDSRSLLNDIKAEIQGGQWAPGALKRVIRKRARQFEQLEDEYLRERASDLRELGRRVLAQLQEQVNEPVVYPKQTILISEEMTATGLLEVPHDNVVGIISAKGSGNSHVAILARSLGIPTVMGFAGCSLNQLENKELIIDGYNGQVYVDTKPAVKKEFKALAAEEHEFDKELSVLADEPAITPDEHTIRLMVNTGLAIDAELSLKVGAEGVGLYRTEIPFMVRDRFPSEDEQLIIYRELLEAMLPRPVVMRTLDIGGDKDLSYFPVDEPNPFLGWRGIRISLDHPELFLAQVRAILRANAGLENVSIMLPMISSIRECETAQALIHQAFDELTNEGYNMKMPRIGIMIEVPAAVYQAHELAKRVDFISVGSNDLTQYLLAVDRNNERVANRYDSLHPAVLRALSQVAKAVRKVNRPLSICGELAADPLAAVLLMAMGFDSLSMNARSLPRIKWVVRHVSLVQAKLLLSEVLLMDDAREVHEHMETALDTWGLGGMIRAGRD